MSLREVGVTDGGKIHLMVKKGEGVASTPPAPGSSKTLGSPPALDFFVQLDTFLAKHLTQEQTNKVVNEFRKVLFTIATHLLYLELLGLTLIVFCFLL